LEEERRLCYVGLTRARNRVYLSHAITRARFGTTETRRPSVFLTDIPDELVDKSGWSFPRRPRPTPPGRRGIIDLRKVIAARRQRMYCSKIAFLPGDKVNHEMFGPGTVVKIPVAEGDDTITVAFEAAGLKKLALGVAPLEKV
jgi:DNA helicase-2/ATP-dependent DNA helicase PcrA